MKLGKLKEVPLREVWEHEQYGFSAWLSDEENIAESVETNLIFPFLSEIGKTLCSFFAAERL